VNYPFRQGGGSSLAEPSFAAPASREAKTFFHQRLFSFSTFFCVKRKWEEKAQLIFLPSVLFLSQRQEKDQKKRMCANTHAALESFNSHHALLYFLHTSSTARASLCASNSVMVG
jgi:hypothetical protein